MVEIYCTAAIYDQNDSRKRIFTIGAAYLVEEDRGDKGRIINRKKRNPTLMQAAINIGYGSPRISRSDRADV